jgi:D-alanine-D-alanine ligase-like ATP-grasp enzyme
MRVALLDADPLVEAARRRSRGILPGESRASLLHSIARLRRTNDAAAAALVDLGHRVVRVPVGPDLAARLADDAADLVFSTYFGPGSRLDQPLVSSVVAWAGTPQTGGGPLCHFLGLSKHHAKERFVAAGIPTPRWTTAVPAGAAVAMEEAGLRFPVIVKPCSEGEGVGLQDRSVARGPEEALAAARRLAGRRAEPALIEEYLPGREFTVGVVEGLPTAALPVMEILPGAVETYSHAAKMADALPTRCPADLPPGRESLLVDLAVRAGRCVGCRDYWRTDLREDVEGVLHVLEVNTLPGLQPGYSDLVRIAEAGGTSFRDLTSAILDSARDHLPLS